MLWDSEPVFCYIQFLVFVLFSFSPCIQYNNFSIKKFSATVQNRRFIYDIQVDIMTSCQVGLRMAIHLFVLPCIVPYSFFSHFLVKDICINV